MIPKDERVANLRAANERKTAAAREGVRAAVRSMLERQVKINVHAVASEANVSRGFIYGQADLLNEIRRASREERHRLRTVSPSSNEASLTARLATALDQNALLRDENRELKRRIENLTAQLVAGGARTR